MQINLFGYIKVWSSNEYVVFFLNSLYIKFLTKTQAIMSILKVGINFEKLIRRKIVELFIFKQKSNEFKTKIIL